MRWRMTFCLLQGLVNQAYINDEYWEEFEECTDYLQKGKLTEAARKGKYNIPYACGDIMAQITDGALTDHSLFDFWNIMLADIKNAREYTQVDYFATMEKLGASKSIIARLKMLTRENVEDPKRFLSSLMQDSGPCAKI